MDASKAGQTLKIHCSAQRPDVCRWLSPFILSCCVYFCLWIPEDQLSWFAALIKCLPVLCLAGFLWIMSPSGGYTRLLQGALVCSAVGDACLIWPEAFLPDSASEDLTGSKLLSKTLFDFCIHDVLSVTHSREATSPSMALWTTTEATAAAPKADRIMSVEARTSSSITLSWAAPRAQTGRLPSTGSRGMASGNTSTSHCWLVVEGFSLGPSTPSLCGPRRKE
ncbi:lysoplasmalogenase TMEM86B isoform X2 [Pongo abelii]|uniref:lysoplasmalogenase TMEM86B isoform X2 n=1 Tax=Pongo abelii TaxID=9601 RepID=UPI0023E7F736|nr:lysoplasmalogenase isoform X2 [Pongo abelii]